MHCYGDHFLRAFVANPTRSQFENQMTLFVLESLQSFQRLAIEIEKRDVFPM